MPSALLPEPRAIAESAQATGLLGCAYSVCSIRDQASLGRRVDVISWDHVSKICMDPSNLPARESEPGRNFRKGQRIIDSPTATEPHTNPLPRGFAFSWKFRTFLFFAVLGRVRTARRSLCVRGGRRNCGPWEDVPPICGRAFGKKPGSASGLFLRSPQPEISNCLS